jgi:hypothetical protein
MPVLGDSIEKNIRAVSPCTRIVSHVSSVSLIALAAMVCVSSFWLQCQDADTKINCVAFDPNTDDQVSADEFIRQTFRCETNCSVILDHNCWRSIVKDYADQQDCPRTADKGKKIAELVLTVLFVMGSLAMFGMRDCWYLLNWVVCVIMLLLLVISFYGSSPAQVPVGLNLPCSVVDRVNCLVHFKDGLADRLIAGRYAVLDLQETWRFPVFLTLACLIGFSLSLWIASYALVECEISDKDEQSGIERLQDEVEAEPIMLEGITNGSAPQITN